MNVCPIPFDRYPVVTLAHGGGGRLMHDLINDLFLSAFDNSLLHEGHDGAVFSPETAKCAFTTDSYVVSPLFFPGGDIGKLAIYGTVNDLSMCGARPRYLSLGVILEEGFSMETLWRVVQSLAQAAAECRVQVVTGDTKVVERGSGDGIFINTSGVGELFEGAHVSPARVQPGDAILLSGDIGRHGIAVLEAREQLGFRSKIESDAAPLAAPVKALFDAGVEVHCLRDLTRGGLGSALCEIAQSGRRTLSISEKAIPVEGPVRGASEMLGLDPLYIANEGRFICFVPEKDSDKAFEALKKQAVSHAATVIGRVLDESSSLVQMESVLGTTRVIDMLSGEQLPRIC